MTFFEAVRTAFFAAFLALAVPRPLAGEAAFRPAFLATLEAGLPALGADLAAFLPVLAAFLPARPAVARSAHMTTT